MDRTALFLSPHLDDVAFSCGGTMARLRREGWRVAMATVFTASVLDPEGFALDCQLDKGLPADVDYMALRRAEDAAFARVLGVEDLDWLGLPEAPHRGYESAGELFDAVRPDDAIDGDVSDMIEILVEQLQPTRVFAPQGIGGHVDHLQVVRAVLRLPALAEQLAWYRDLPYAEKFPEARPDPRINAFKDEFPVPIEPADLQAKLDGCACYVTQVPFQFDDEAAMRIRLASFAVAEGTRFAQDGPAEAFRATRSIV